LWRTIARRDCGNGRGGRRVLLYLAQEGRGIGLINKLRAYRLQDQGFDTVEANERLGFESDERMFQPAARMLRILGYTKVRLMTNNPDKVAGLEALGLRSLSALPIISPPIRITNSICRSSVPKAGIYYERLGAES